MKRYIMILGILFAAIALLAVGLTAMDQISGGNSKGMTPAKVATTNVASAASKNTLEAVAETSSLWDTEATKDSKQGGETIETATVIASMPYNVTGTTTGYADDYDEICSIEAAQTMPDVVYSYTPAFRGILNVSSCASSYFTRLWVYRSNADTLIACNRFHTSCGTPVRASLVDIELDADATYYIVVDGDVLFGDGSGDYSLACTYEAVAQVDSTMLHPAISDNGAGAVMLAWEENASDTDLYWFGSNNDGSTFPAGGSFNGIYHYPSLAYWGSSTIFYGTQVPDAAQSSGAPVYLLTFPDPTNTGTWESSAWNWGGSGWHDMRDIDIACDNSMEFPDLPGDYRFGAMSFIQSTTYLQGATNAPHLFMQTDAPNYGGLSLYWLDDCNSTSITIDHASKLLYAVYDLFDPDSSQWILFVNRELFGDPDDTLYSEAYLQALDNASEHVMYPQVAAYDSNVVIVTEYYTDTAPEDRDIVCWYNPGSDGSIETLVTSVISASVDDERFPRVQHIGGTIFAATFIKGDTLMMSVSQDAGVTWGTPQAVSLVPGDNVVAEYKATDFSEYGAKAAWEYRNAGSADSSIFIHFSSLFIDSDEDLVGDAEDNCPTVSNSGQENSDGDSYGDACDNCPTVTNEDQADVNENGVGDVCDYIPGDANGDGSVNITDAIFTINYIFRSGPVPDPLESADANCDGSVNVTDAIYLINYIFRSGPAPTLCTK